MRQVSFLVLDVDDVLVQMKPAELAAEAAVRAPLEPALGAEKASFVQASLASSYQILRDQLWAAPGVKLPTWVELRRRIDAWQRGVTEEGHEVKQWSRDTLIAIALEDAGVSPTAALIAPAVDAYWRTLGDESRLWPDALALLDHARANGVSFHLATNSDGFLRFDDRRRTFVYDPDDARERKLARLHVLGKAGVRREDITVGDPIGKPSPKYFEKVMEDFSEKLSMSIDRRQAMAVGDSLAADVLPPMSIGVGHGAWLDRHGAGPPAAPPVRTVRSLSELIPLP